MNLFEQHTSHLRKLVLLLAMTLSCLAYSYGQIGCYAVELESANSEFVQIDAAPVCPETGVGNEFTIGAWFYLNSLPTSSANYQVILSIVDGADADNDGTFAIRVENGPTDLRVFSYDGGALSVNLDVNAGLAINTWYYVSVVHDGTNVELFLDGNSLGTDAGPLTAGCNANTTLIGRRQLAGPPPGNQDFFNGQIDDVAIWSSALSESDIDNLALETASAEATAPGSLEAYYDMEDGMGTTATDESANSNDGTLVNGAEFNSGSSSISCMNNPGVSLDPVNCTAVITPNDLLNSATLYQECYQVTVFGTDGVTPLNPMNEVTASLIGEQLNYTITHIPSQNECDGTITIQDGASPVIDLTTCPAAVTVTCGEGTTPADLGTPTATDCATVSVTSVDSGLSNGSCASGIFQTFTRTWTADDGSSTPSTCVQTITVNRIALASITAPANATVDCDASTDPSNPDIGYPQGNGMDVTEMLSSCGLQAATPSDIVVGGGLGCASMTIFRTWTVLTCEGSEVLPVQTITVEDNDGPTFTTCPSSETISTSQYDCLSDTYTLGAAVASDNCSSVTYSTTVDGAIFNGSSLDDLSVGDHPVVVTAIDGCNNPSSNTCSYTITVEDQVPPAMSCETSRTVTLNGSSPTLIPSTVFDDGSWDNCNAVTFLARRMDSPDCNGGISSFDNFVPFHCCDVGATDPIMVILQASDGTNTNTCMVEVIVEDKNAPTISCPANVIVDCMESTAIADTGGSATATDECNFTITSVDFTDLNSCNIGTITRRWKATDDSGNVDSCDQIITVSNLTPFDGSTITFPADITITCGGDTSTTVTGLPGFSEGACDLVGMIYEDNHFPITGNACGYILRTFTVFDGCQAPTSTSNCNSVLANVGIASWCDTQMIMIEDDNDPVVTTSWEDRTFPSSSDNCDDGPVVLTISATDGCVTDNLNYYWEIDVDNDDNSNPELTGNTNSISETLAIGTHRVYWKVEDFCGNFRDSFYLVSVADQTPPVIVYAAEGVAFAGLHPTNPLEVWASDMVLSSSYDNCGIAEYRMQKHLADLADTDVVPATAQTALSFLCDVLPATETSVTFDLDVWAIDVNGNVDYALIPITLQDNLNACGNGSPVYANVTGGIQNEEGTEVEHVTVEVTGAMTDQEETTETGLFSFDLPTNNNYVLTPERNDNPLNGVSTFDLVKISKHILNIELLPTPYKRIAADINRSGTITTFDLVALRKVILFIDEEFQDNTSWRFVDAGFVFPDPTNPFATSFPEVYSINDLADNEISDFIAVKIGDVNCSAAANDFADGSSDDRNNGESLVFNTKDQTLKAGEVYTVDFNLDKVSNLQGYQFTLAFDAGTLAFENLSPGSLAGMSENNFGLHKLEEGVITTSWHNTEMVNLDKATSFSLTFTALKDAQLSEALTINSRYTKAQAYLNNEFSDVSIAFESENGFALEHFQLFQNRPNPFKGETVISFNLPKENLGTLTIYDLAGRQIKAIQTNFNKGYNEVSISSAELNGHGVFYYQLEVEDYTATRKMVLLK